MRYEQAALTMALGALLVTACKKDKEVTPPSVTILAPAEGSTFQVPDTLTVTVQVSDDAGVEQVTFALLNADQIPVLPASVVRPSSNPATISVAIPLISDHLPGGDLTLVVTASDGSSDGKEYRTIGLVPSALRTRGVFAVGAPAGGPITISKLDSTGQLSTVNTLISDLGGAAVSSWDQRLLVAGSVTGPLVALGADAMSVPWELANLGNNSSAYFTALDLCADGRLYVGTSDGYVRARSAATGNILLSMNIGPDWRCDKCATTSTYLICAEHQFTSQAKRWSIRFRSSGSTFSQIPTTMTAIALLPRDDDHVLIFGNEGTSASVVDLSLSGGGGWTPYSWSSPITAVARIDDNTFAVALADGSLNRFTYSNAASVQLGSGPVLNDLAGDAVSGVLYGVTAADLRTINTATGQPIDVFPIAGGAQHVLPLYNR